MQDYGYPPCNYLHPERLEANAKGGLYSPLSYMVMGCHVLLFLKLPGWYSGAYETVLSL